MTEIWGLFLRTVFVYFFIFLMMRLMGKREVGKLSVFDLIVSFMVADISAISLESLDKPLIDGLLPIFTIVLLQIILSYITLKYKKVREVIDGKPSIIINKGKLDHHTMAKSRYNIDDLMMQLREKDIADIGDVEFAILETSGKLSVFLKTEKLPVTVEYQYPDRSYPPFRLPSAIIIEGEVQPRELQKAGKDRAWLDKQLRQRGYQGVQDIFYASLNQVGELYIDQRLPHPSSQQGNA